MYLLTLVPSHFGYYCKTYISQWIVIVDLLFSKGFQAIEMGQGHFAQCVLLL